MFFRFCAASALCVRCLPVALYCFHIFSCRLSPYCSSKPILLLSVLHDSSATSSLLASILLVYLSLSRSLSVCACMREGFFLERCHDRRNTCSRRAGEERGGQERLKGGSNQPQKKNDDTDEKQSRAEEVPSRHFHKPHQGIHDYPIISIGSFLVHPSHRRKQRKRQKKRQQRGPPLPLPLPSRKTTTREAEGTNMGCGRSRREHG